MSFSQSFRTTISSRSVSNLWDSLNKEPEKPVDIQIKPRLVSNCFMGGWFMTNKLMIEQAMFDDFFDARSRVMWAFMVLTEGSQKEVLIVGSKLAEELKIHPVTLSETIKGLIKKNYIIRGEKVQKSYYYRMNPYIVWKGSGEEHRKAVNGVEKPDCLLKKRKKPSRHPSRSYLGLV